MTTAMILSLLLSTLIILPAIAIVGISEIGEMAIGSEGSATYAANMTFWNTYSSFGLATIIPFVVGGTILVALLIVTIKKIDHKKEVRKYGRISIR